MSITDHLTAALNALDNPDLSDDESRDTCRALVEAARDLAKGRPTFGPFVIDTANSDEQYLYVDVPTKSLSVVIKLDDEGIVVDVYPARVADGPAATLSATYEEVEESAWADYDDRGNDNNEGPYGHN